MELKEEIKKEYRNCLTWSDQISNILSSLMWALGVWLSIITISIMAIGIAFFLTWDINQGTSLSLAKDSFKYLIIYVGVISALIVALFGLPNKVRNIFKDNAEDRIERYIALKREYDSQIETIDLLLLKYDLITKKQVIDRKSKNKPS